MTRVSTAGTATAVVIGVDEKAGSNSSSVVHRLHKVREGEARGDGDAEVDNSVESILEEAVVTSKGPRDPAELEEVVPHHFSRKAFRYP